MTTFDYLGIADDGTILVAMDDKTYNKIMRYIIKETYNKAWRECQEAHEMNEQ